jgi:hypothetical protein
VRRAATVIALLAVARVAAADATVPGIATSDPLAKCTMEDGPIRRVWNSGLADRAKRASGNPSVSLTSVGRKHLVLASGEENTRATVILRAATLERVAELGKILAPTVVEDTSGALLGLVAVNEPQPQPHQRRLRLFSIDGNVRWGVPVPAWHNAAVALVAGDLLVVGLFHRIATGSDLIAVDVKTGALRWKADVVQMQVAHSKYWNDVALDLDGGRVVMRGYEAAGCYEQTFDLATGRRISSRMGRRW